MRSHERSCKCAAREPARPGGRRARRRAAHDDAAGVLPLPLLPGRLAAHAQGLPPDETVSLRRERRGLRVEPLAQAEHGPALRAAGAPAEGAAGFSALCGGTRGEGCWDSLVPSQAVVGKSTPQRCACAASGGAGRVEDANHQWTVVSAVRHHHVRSPFAEVGPVRCLEGQSVLVTHDEQLARCETSLKLAHLRSLGAKSRGCAAW